MAASVSRATALWGDPAQSWLCPVISGYLEHGDTSKALRCSLLLTLLSGLLRFLHQLYSLPPFGFCQDVVWPYGRYILKLS